MQATKSDAACFFERENGQLTGITDTGQLPVFYGIPDFVRHRGAIMMMASLQVDDSLLLGTKTFMEREMVTSRLFPSKGRETIGSSPVAFNGIIHDGCHT